MWLLEQEFELTLSNAYRNAVTPTDSQIALIPEAREAGAQGQSYVIPVIGVLTKSPDFIAAFFGGGNTLYTDIIDGIREAESDSRVKEIVLLIDSPGGNTDGLFDAMDAVKAAKKPVRAEIDGLAASAAYGIASQANEITALSRGARIGSIGTAISFFVSDNFIDIASTESPEKRPDVRTEEGKEVVRKQLDRIHEMFVGSIAEGRGTDVSTVNSEYGRGGMFLAPEALKIGMIDSIGFTEKKETEAMDLATLKAQHPAVYQQAFDEGKAHERDRVEAHVIMGEAAGAMDIAAAAIKEGTTMTDKMRASYMAAGLGKKELEDMAGDNTAIDDKPGQKKPKKSAAEQALDLLTETDSEE